MSVMNRGPWFIPLILGITVFLIYWNSLQCGFVFDDASAIKENKDLRPKTPISKLFLHDFWGTPMHQERSHKSYRPLCVLTFRWNYAISELEPMSYHLVNIFLHALVCCLYYRLCRTLVNCWCALVASLLFAVHPVHTEAVTGVVGRAELLSSIFFILALIAYTRSAGPGRNTRWRWLFATVVQVAVAMLCKEQGITVIGVCCVYELFVMQQASVRQLLNAARDVVEGWKLPSWFSAAIRRMLVLVGATVCLLMARVKVMGAQLPVFTKFDNPAAASDWPARHLTYNYLLPINAWLLLNPDELCCDWTMGTIPLVEGLADIRNLTTLFFYAVTAKLGYKLITSRSGQTQRALIMSVSLIVLPFIPASNLFFPVGFVVAERVLYTPSMGFCLLVAVGFQELAENYRKLRSVLVAGMAFLLLTHSCKTYVRNFDWESEYTLFQAALRVNANNAKLYNNVGHALEAQQDYIQALEYFSKAAQVQPDDIGAHMNVGRTLNTLNRTVEAEEAYRKALELFPPVKQGQSYTARIAPNHLNVFLNLGTLVAKDDSRLHEADALYRSAIAMRADYTQAYINRGDILVRLNRTEEARQQYLAALHYQPDNADIHYNLGVVALQENQQIQAMKYFESALSIDPEHLQSLFNSAVLAQELGDPRLRPEAIDRLLLLSKFEPENEKVYFNLGMLAMDDLDFVEAEKWFKMAILLKPDFRSALFNLALMQVNDLKRPLDAVPVLEQLLKHHPLHTKGLILMGDLNINVLRDVDAAETNFLTILEHEPENVQASHNLCVVYVQRGELVRAEQCLRHVSSLAPNETYIQRHLEIVQARRQQQSDSQRGSHQTNQGANQQASHTGSDATSQPNKQGASQSANQQDNQAASQQATQDQPKPDISKQQSANVKPQHTVTNQQSSQTQNDKGSKDKRTNQNSHDTGKR